MSASNVGSPVERQNVYRTYAQTMDSLAHTDGSANDIDTRDGFVETKGADGSYSRAMFQRGQGPDQAGSFRYITEQRDKTGKLAHLEFAQCVAPSADGPAAAVQAVHVDVDDAGHLSGTQVAGQGAGPTVEAPLTPAEAQAAVVRLTRALDANWIVAPHTMPAQPPGPPKINVPFTTTPSGLQYADIKVGNAVGQARPGMTVEVAYTGWLSNGMEFDASAKHGDGTFRFPLGKGQVIKGWDEGVAGMGIGGVRRLVVPPNLAYGQRGAPGVIPPNATLTFDVELKGWQTLP